MNNIYKSYLDNLNKFNPLTNLNFKLIFFKKIKFYNNKLFFLFVALNFSIFFLSLSTFKNHSIIQGKFFYLYNSFI